LDLGLRGKVALVAGGSSGIGLAVATELAAEGAHVAIGARGVEQLRRAADGLQQVAAGGRIKADSELGNIPIIAVTSYALSGDEAKSLAAGCDGYIAKPFSPRKILAMMRDLLR